MKLVAHNMVIVRQRVAKYGQLGQTRGFRIAYGRKGWQGFDHQRLMGARSHAGLGLPHKAESTRRLRKAVGA
jgi:hypothetical protein